MGVGRLPGLCGALRAAGGPGVARLLLAGPWGWMRGQLRFWTTTARAEIREPRLEMLSSPLVRLLEAAGDEPREEIVAALRGYGTTCWAGAVHAREIRAAQGHDRPGVADAGVGDGPPGTSLLSTWRHDDVVRPWKRRLSDGERSVLLSELLLRHPELVAEAEEITSTLLVVEDDQELAGEITARLRALRPSGPVSVDAGRGRVLHVLQPYIDDLSWRKERGARRAAAEIAIAILLGLYECRDDTDADMLLVRMGLPGTADDLAHMVYKKVKSLQLPLPSLADECPEWAWYQQS